MPRFVLHAHRDTMPKPDRGVAIDLTRTGEILILRFQADPAAHIRWPAPAPSARTDALWRFTCFELFLMLDDDERYVEFNFSPSTCWAAYGFDGYRDGMRDLALRTPPVVERLADGVAVRCDVAGLPHGELRMGLSAVIEETEGTKSYWALAHAPGPPDFHHPACFAARLPAPEGA